MIIYKVALLGIFLFGNIGNILVIFQGILPFSFVSIICGITPKNY